MDSQEYELKAIENKITEIVQKITEMRKNLLKKKSFELENKYYEKYEELNDIIYELYGINKKNKEQIKKFLKDPNISRFHL